MSTSLARRDLCAYFHQGFSSLTLLILCAQLIAITVSMNEHVPPKRPDEVYSQGYWHAVIAAVLYLVSSMILMLNMLGYFLGHYPQHFELTDEQRNLILQTMMFFVWLAGGGAVFARVEGWSFVDAVRATLYSRQTEWLNQISSIFAMLRF